jgi:hypothetical protein
MSAVHFRSPYAAFAALFNLLSIHRCAGTTQPVSSLLNECRCSGGTGGFATRSRTEAECNRCKSRASLPLDAIRRPRDTPIWKLEASLKCRSCKKGRYAPPVRMIKLTETREITPYKWVHPDEER